MKEGTKTALAAVFAVASLGLLWAVFSIDFPVKAERCGGDIDAFVTSQSFVKERLRAPSTAKFPTIAADNVEVRNYEECRFQVIAYVDAQNAFGGTVRQIYEARLEYIPDRNVWALDSLDLH